MSRKPIGILLLGFGGVDSLDAVEPFMKNLMGGRVPPPPLVEKMKARYQLIGGKSPLPEITAVQAKKLEDYLNSKGGNYKAAVGMCYWHPFISEGLTELISSGAEKIIGLSLAPFYSKVSTGAYERELRKAAGEQAQQLQVVMTDPFFDNESYIEAVTLMLSQLLNENGLDKETPVIFSAHSLPITTIEQGDPYAEQFKVTVEKVASQAGLTNVALAYQSKGGGQGQWLDPTVEEVMNDLKVKGYGKVVVVPVGFVSDHIETLYDVDIAQKAHAESLGMNFYRTPALNTHDLFIQALADAVLLKSE